MAPRRTPLQTWAQLFRLPNLFTVPGDAIAGGLLAASASSPLALTSLFWAACSVISLYMGGLLFNDYFDRDEDRRDRPDRPIPNGDVLLSSVAIVALWCFVVGIITAWLAGGLVTAAIALAIAGVATLYDAGGKRMTTAGPAMMASCRAGSVLLGASALAEPALGGIALALGAALAHGVFIFFVTRVAANETSAEAPHPIALFAPTAATGGLAALVLLFGASGLQLIAWTLLVCALAEGFLAARAVVSRKMPVPPFIGKLIRTLITWQALWIVVGLGRRGLVVTIVALAIGAVLRLGADHASRRFYGS